MFSYIFINSHSQVSNPGPKGPLVFEHGHMAYQIDVDDE